MALKYKNGTCKHCGKPCWKGCGCCGVCYNVVFKHNRNGAYDDFIYKTKGSKDVKW